MHRSLEKRFLRTSKLIGSSRSAIIFQDSKLHSFTLSLTSVFFVTIRSQLLGISRRTESPLVKILSLSLVRSPKHERSSSSASFDQQKRLFRGFVSSLLDFSPLAFPLLGIWERSPRRRGFFSLDISCAKNVFSGLWGRENRMQSFLCDLVGDSKLTLGLIQFRVFGFGIER